LLKYAKTKTVVIIYDYSEQLRWTVTV